MTHRCAFLKKSVNSAAITVTAFSPPFFHAKKIPNIKWQLQTYAGTALAAQVIKPPIDVFNRAVNDGMVIDLFYTDQFVPTDVFFKSMQKATINALQGSDQQMPSPVEFYLNSG